MAPPTLTGAPTYIRPTPRSTHRAGSSTAPVQRTSVNRADDLGLRHGVRIRHDDIVLDPSLNLTARTLFWDG